MKHYFQAQLSAYITFTNDEWDLLMQSFRQHYDSQLKAAVLVGGFMYGANGRRDFGDGESEELDFTWRQLDKMLKSLEFNHSDDALELFKKINSLLKELSEKAGEINKTLAPDEDATN